MRPRTPAAGVFALALVFAGACRAPTEADGALTQLRSPPRAPAANVQPWPITDLGTLPGGIYSAARDINASSIAVGYSDVGGGVFHAFRWVNGAGMQDLGALGPGAQKSDAYAVNDGGDVVGYSENGTGWRRAIIWTAATGMVELPSDPAAHAVATDITNTRIIVGCGALPGSGQVQVLRWAPSGAGWSVTGLGAPAGGLGSACAAGTTGPATVGSFLGSGLSEGFILAGGNYRALGAGTRAARIVAGRTVGAGGINAAGGGLPWEWPGVNAAPWSLGYLYVPSGTAEDVNGSNHIVGTLVGPPDPAFPTNTRAFYWDCHNGLVDLGSLGGRLTDFASAAAINRDDVVAGASNNHAALWGVVPTAPTVVALPFAGPCVVPPVVRYRPNRFLNIGILSRPGFDATLLDPATVTISDGFGHVTPIARRAKPPGPPTRPPGPPTRPPGPPVFEFRDLNRDGVLDLRVTFSTTAMIANGTLTPASFQFVVGWVDATGLPGQGQYPIRVR